MSFNIDYYQGTSTPFGSVLGPRVRPKIAIVGEAWGQQEALAGLPFQGTSGQELTRLLSEAGISRSDCFLTNVFPFQPQANDIEQLCVNKAGAGLQYPMPPLRTGKYIDPRLLGEVERLRTELTAVQPNLILALGNTACWALLARTNIGAIRGSIAEGVLVKGTKVLPTYHPAAVLRNWSLRVITLADMMKAELERHFAEIRRPERWVTISPTLAAIAEWVTRPATAYAADIETSRGQITMIGFARSRSDSIVIPFVDDTKSHHHYWDSPGDEVVAWGLVQQVLAGPVPKIFQNGVYDMGYLLRQGMRLNSCLHDTMLLHHSLYPELQKGLGFLGSTYTNESSWKLMRNAHRADAFKRDE